MSGRRRASWLAGLVLAALAGSAQPFSAGAAGAPESLEFTNAVLLTPVRSDGVDRLFKFAPLIVIETAATNLAGMPVSDRPGFLERAHGLVRVNPSPPAVYAQRDSVIYRGQRLERFSYVWWYPPDSTAPRDSTWAAQGIRITASPAGQSLIFEVFRSPTTTAVVTVSQSLESAALAEFRRSLPGRRFAVELPAENPLAAAVTRVIDDGPLDLGPVVYVQEGHRTIGTVICRCMPAQVRNIADTGYYRLVPWSDDDVPAMLEEAKARVFPASAWWPSPWIETTNLEIGLRLPTRLPGTDPVP